LFTEILYLFLVKSRRKTRGSRSNVLTGVKFKADIIKTDCVIEGLIG